MLSSSKTVRTVTGDVPAAALGHTQCHEHIYLRKGPGYAVNPALCMDDEALSLRELRDYYRAGGRTIVDAQPGGYGRDARKLLQLSRESQVQILAVTGFHKQAFAEEAQLLQQSENALCARFSDEITEGMLTPQGQRTDARAGVVKAAWDTGGLQEPVVRKLFCAAAGAAAQTGAPVLIHTEPDTQVWEMLELFGQYGVSPQRLLLCHLDRTIPDPGLHREVLAAGCRLCYDSVNRLKYVSHAQELALLVQMCDAGYEEQIVLSLDTTAARLRAYGAADMGLDYLLRDFRPMLLQAGVQEDVIEKLYRTNAAQILCMM